ncbi:major facilitator superfamily transporter, partial [Periconia macrospinosa]
MLPILTFYSYLPGVIAIATDLRVSIQAVNLSLTFFLIVQGIAPIFWQPFIDTLGRRTVYMCSLIVYIVTTINLSLSWNYPMWLVSRGFQAAGVASLASIGCAVIQDIVPSASRPRYVTIYQHVRNMTLFFSPIIGGLMTASLDFRCVAILLFALGLTYLTTILFFLPETLRAIAGNGTVPLKGIHVPIIHRLKFLTLLQHESPLLSPRATPRVSAPNFLRPLLLLREKDIVPNLLFPSIVYGIWIMVTVSTVPLFTTAFPNSFSPSTFSLLFLPNILGTIAGTSLIGNLLASDFSTATTIYKDTNWLPSSIVISKLSLPSDFPLERTRLARLPGLIILFIISTSFYGFTLMYPSLTTLPGWPTIPLLLQFLIATTAHSICGIHQTLVSDLWPLDAPAASVAANFVKGVFAGSGVAGIQWMVKVVEAGPAFLGLGFIVCMGVPLVVGEWVWGAAWRRER